MNRWRAAGMALAALGLAGFLIGLVARPEIPPPTELARGEEFRFTAVVAGRDTEFSGPGVRAGWGNRTDTILFVNVAGEAIDLVAIPRDTLVDLPRVGQRRINTAYAYGGAPGLRGAVESLLGVRVDYHAIITMDFFKKVVDALGGVEVFVSAPMRYTDLAGGLEIDIPAGLVHLDGRLALDYVRFRGFIGSDLGRIDRMKDLIGRLAAKARTQAVVSAIPGLIRAVREEVETDLPLGLLQGLAARADSAQLNLATLPVEEGMALIDGLQAQVLFARPERVDAFLTARFGAPARRTAQVPEVRVLITDRSGIPGLGREAARAIVALGLPEPQVRIRADQGQPSAVRVDPGNLAAGAFYGELLRLGVSQVNQLFLDTDVEIVLGQDAAERYPVLAARAGVGR